MDDGDILLLTGPPGAGKSTVASAIVDGLERAVLVCGDDVLASVVRGFIPPWQPESDSQNRAAVAATAATAREFASAGYPVVVDAVLGPWHLDLFADVVERPFTYVVLRPSKDVALARAVVRAAGALTDVDAVSFMWEQFADLGRHESAGLDTSEQSVADTAGSVIARLRADAEEIP